MLSFKEYTMQKESVEYFEVTIYLAVLRMKGITRITHWNIQKDVKISIEPDCTSVTTPDQTYLVPTRELKKFLKKGQWVVKYSTVHDIRKASIYKTKHEAVDEYKFQLAHTAPDDHTVYWVKEPVLMDWDDLAFFAWHDPDEYDWC